MAKTNFQDGTPVTPAWLNAVNNPEYKETPSNDGELPLPPSALSSSQGRPPQLFLNSSLCGDDDQDGLSTIEFEAVDQGYNMRCAGMRAQAKTANLVGVFLANAAGDPARGLWAWNVAGNAPQNGDNILYYPKGEFYKMGGIYNRQMSTGQATEVTFQVELKNDASSNSGTADILAALNITNESDLISENYIQLIEKSDPVVLSNGQVATLWVHFKILKILTSDLFRAIFPEISITQQGSGNFQHQIKSLCVFEGNTFGKKLFSDDDRGLATAVARGISTKNKRTIDPVISLTKDDFTPNTGVVLNDSFEFFKYPDRTIRAKGSLTFDFTTGGAQTLLASATGNPLGIETQVGATSVVQLGTWFGDRQVAIVYDNVLNETRLEFGAATASAGTQFITAIAPSWDFYD